MHAAKKIRQEGPSYVHIWTVANSTLIRAAASAIEARRVLSNLIALQIDIRLAVGYLSDKYLKSIRSKSYSHRILNSVRMAVRAAHFQLTMPLGRCRAGSP